MFRTKFTLTSLAALIALALACSNPSSTVTSPTGTSAGTSNASASGIHATAGGVGSDGSTLKVTAPTPQSPINDQRADSIPTLVATASAGKFAAIAVQYRFQVFNAADALVYDSGPVGSSTHEVSGLEFNSRHTWRVRAESPEGLFGPWSKLASFLTPEGGYIRGNELYDPLHNGKTVGVIHGPVTFVPGVGAKLETQLAYISYQLPQTLNEGEFSLLVTNMPANTEGGKTKLFAMGQGYDDIVTNDRRMTIEKRGDPPGVIAWRFITHDDQVDTEGADRIAYNFLRSETYFFQATWRNNFFNLLIKEGGVDGRVVYQKGKGWDGRPYDPNPHVIYVGAPVGRSGPDGASVNDAIIRNVWVSGNPRPASAN